MKIVLATAAQTCLLQLDWSLAVHITAPDENGYAHVDTEDRPIPSQERVDGTRTNELLQVKLDGSVTIRWANHRSRPLNSYNWQPKLTISRDGTSLLFASDFDLQSIYGYPADYSDEYLMVLGSATTSTAPASVAPQCSARS